MARHDDGLRRREFFKVLVPCCLQSLRVPGEIAGLLADGAGGGGDGDDGAVRLVGALGKVWRVQVRRERDGGNGGQEKAFLARGWAEFARAHGVGVGWFVVFRLQGRGVLSVKAFDRSLCRRPFCAPCPGFMGKKMGARPQFIRILFPELCKKMPLPRRFSRNHMAQDDAGREATIYSPLGKFWHIGLEHDGSCVFLVSGWAEFLEAHGISEGHLLVFRYQGNMVFTVKVFEPSGCRKEYCAVSSGDGPGDRPHPENKQPEVSCTSRKRKCASENASHARDGDKPKCSPTNVNKTKARPKPVHLITKIVTARALSHGFTIGRERCTSVGLPTTCEVTLKTPARRKRSWKAIFRTANTYCYLQSGWKKFCRDNNLREGDQCTINVVDRTLWHVIIRPSKPR